MSPAQPSPATAVEASQEASILFTHCRCFGGCVGQRPCMTPQHCPFCSFLHAFLGPPLHWSPNLSLPKRHRKQCIVCPATKGNAETPKWPPHSQPTSFTQNLQTLGDLESSDCQRSFTIWHPCGPGNIPSLFFEGSMPGGPLAVQHRVWRKVRRGHTEQKHRIWETRHSPLRNLAGWERLLCSL